MFSSVLLFKFISDSIFILNLSGSLLKMEPENIDWDNIDSTFVQDDKFENFDAPKWADLSASDEFVVDHEAWFCNHGEILGVKFL